MSNAKTFSNVPTVLKVRIVGGNNTLERGFTSVQGAWDYASANRLESSSWVIQLDVGNNGSLSIGTTHDNLLSLVAINGYGIASTIGILLINSASPSGTFYVSNCYIGTLQLGNPTGSSSAVSYFFESCKIGSCIRASTSLADTARNVSISGRSTFGSIDLGGATGATGTRGNDVGFYSGDILLINGGLGGDGQEAYNLTVLEGVYVVAAIYVKGGSGGIGGHGGDSSIGAAGSGGTGGNGKLGGNLTVGNGCFCLVKYLDGGAAGPGGGNGVGTPDGSAGTPGAGSSPGTYTAPVWGYPLS